MFDRFTDRARKVMGYARHEAVRLGHDYIGTEHMLLGIMLESSGVAANVLENLDVDLDKVRAEVERCRAAGSATPMGPLPFNQEAKRALDESIAATRELHHKYVGTEHVLLGLLRVDDCVAAKVLAGIGLKAEDVQREIMELLSVDGLDAAAADITGAEPMFAPDALKAIRYAVEEAREAGAPFTDIKHLRAGLDRAEKESGEKSG